MCWLRTKRKKKGKRKMRQKKGKRKIRQMRGTMGRDVKREGGKGGTSELTGGGEEGASAPSSSYLLLDESERTFPKKQSASGKDRPSIRALLHARKGLEKGKREEFWSFYQKI